MSIIPKVSSLDGPLSWSVEIGRSKRPNVLVNGLVNFLSDRFAAHF